MFDDNDPEKLMRTDGRIPDGIIDGTQYAEILSRVIDNMSLLQDESYLSNITWIMKCVNECYEPDGNEFNKSRALDVVTSLSYLIMTMVMSIDGEEFIEDYIRDQKENILPELHSNAAVIPFYDINEDVNHILDVLDALDDIENGDSSDED